ncbi:MAG: 50S ribosomal protein L3 [Acidobacteria bacterium]|nr:MAG: 50S ribosomal protein L3 [Acidobacteriota bacterium]
MKGILGIKLGMTQIFEEDGKVVPVTVVKVGPCKVVQRKTTQSDGYEAVQLGLVEERPPRKVTQPLRGHFEKAGVEPTRRLMEVRVQADDPAQPGDEVQASIFAENDYVDVVGTSKGKGFQGVIKRHGFRGGRATHGSMFHRAPGSIGQSAWPSRVFPGVRLPGQTGGKRVTVKNLQVVRVNEEENLIYLRGAVPGARNSYVALREAKRG